MTRLLNDFHKIKSPIEMNCHANYLIQHVLNFTMCMSLNSTELIEISVLTE